jgi:hypothetical protein
MTRSARLEKAMTEMAKSQVRVENALAHLADVQAREIQLTEQRFRELKEEAKERDKLLDERIAKLVSAIGE